MKSTFVISAILGAGVLFSSLVQAAEKFVIGASSTPHGVILEHIKPKLAKQGVDLQIKIFSDFIQPNVQLVNKNLDGNYYQYRPFLNDFNARNKTNLVAVVPVHIEPFVAYSKKIKSLNELKNGATVIIPNDPVNGGRGLLLLAKLKLITLKPGFHQLKKPTDKLPTIKDIATNPKKLKIKELESAILPRMLDQVDLAALNGNYVLEAKLDLKKSLYIERGQDGTNVWAEYLVVRPEDKNKPVVQKIAKALNEPDTRQFILKQFKGEIFPAF
ncbi:MetQ/NlpA family ABC transporter substrate-binding protein [Acinetobacter puyangensis]|uniref:MetQ/NlpA family ABC transporter substrate-binding protein n=1 Tax=Acinetobacter puyangensis TaxID=1096779 RepID=UPI003A4D83DE